MRAKLPVLGDARLGLRLRPAGLTDAHTLHEWACSPDSLAASVKTKAPIPWESHLAWLQARLADSKTLLWIIELRGKPAGQVRLEGGGDGVEVSIYVAPSFRKRGVALSALEQAFESGQSLWSDSRLVARILPGNTASQRLFAAAGFSLAETRDDHLVYERTV
jgi:UDP-2,4-diacetamido-2,4,6-trideoxy-beta-L-altropyranose hydrolase